MDGEVTTVVEVPTQPSGLGWLPDGRMLVVSMVDRKVLRLEPDGLVEHADLSGDRHVPLQRHGRGRARPAPTSGTSASTWTASWPSTVCGPRWASRVRRGRPSPGSTPTARVHEAAVRPAVPERRGDHARRLDDDRGGDDGPAADARSTSRPTARSRTSGCGRRSTAGCPTASASTPRAGVGGRTRLAAECVLVAGRDGGPGEVVEVIETGERCFACMLGGPDGRDLFMRHRPHGGARAGGRGAHRTGARRHRRRAPRRGCRDPPPPPRLAVGDDGRRATTTSRPRTPPTASSTAARRTRSCWPWPTPTTPGGDERPGGVGRRRGRRSPRRCAGRRPTRRPRPASPPACCSPTSTDRSSARAVVRVRRLVRGPAGGPAFTGYAPID